VSIIVIHVTYDFEFDGDDKVGLKGAYNAYVYTYTPIYLYIGGVKGSV
jgi:hypothetical protein